MEKLFTNLKNVKFKKLQFRKPKDEVHLFTIKKNEKSQITRKRILLFLKIVGMLALVSLSVFRITQDWEDLYYVEQPWSTEYESQTVYDKITDEDVLVQKFQADGNYVESIGVLFATYRDSLKKGKVKFVLRNQEGKIEYQETVDVKKLHDNAYYDFNINKKLEKGKYYSYEISTSGFEYGQTPAVWAGKIQNSSSSLTFAGEKQDLEIIYRVASVKFNAVPVVVHLVVLVLILLLLFLPFAFRAFVNNLLGTILLFVLPLLSFYLVESLYQNPFGKDFLTVLFNYLLYFGIYLICFAVTGSFRRTFIWGNSLTFLLGIINYFVLQFRGIPICPWDVFSLGTAADVVGGYSFRFDIKLVASIWCMLAINLFAMHFSKQKMILPIRLGSGTVSMLYVCAVLYLLVGSDVLEANGFGADLWSQQTGYLNNGYFLSFVMNMKYMQVEEPQNYRADRVEEILETYEETQIQQNVQNKPNIIMIMNEAYSDLSIIGNFDTNMDYSPFVHALTENTIKGNLYVSVFGGGTCNTEYEALTGNTMAYLAPGSIAYQQYINQKQETGGLASTLKEQGYTCYAIHPLGGTNWNRHHVYPSMGFDGFYDITSFPKKPEMVRNFISDLESYKKIINLYEKKNDEERLFLFDVTVQNHGGYESDYEFDEPVVLENMNGDYPKTEEYLSLIKISDDAFANLIYYFSQETEPTMIVMFGDHQPAIEEEFYEELYGKSLEDLNLEEMQRRYAVPFIIWTNYDIEEVVIEEMSANYLPGTILKYAGLNIPTYFSFLNAMYQELPIVNVNGYRDYQAQDYTHSDVTDYDKWLNQYKILHYNNSIDKSNTNPHLYAISN